MNKLLIPFLLLTSIPCFSEEFDYKITNIIDGDTIEFSAPFLPPPLKPTLSLRVINVDTPEIHQPKCQIEYKLGKDAKEYTQKIIKMSKSTKIIILQWDKYGGRVDGDVILDGEKLSELLIKNGFARPYHGKKKQSWCEQ